MKVHNFDEKILKYIETNPNLSANELGVLLFIDNIYLDVPRDVEKFKERYPHFDSSIVENGHDGITFLDIVNGNFPDEVAKKKLNDYMNIKFRYIGEFRDYEENAIIFKKYSKSVSGILDDLLVKAKFPREIREILCEMEEIGDCHDIFDLSKIYLETSQRRIKFAILRRIGLVVLLARIKRSFSFEDLEFATLEIENAFMNNLKEDELKPKRYYFWADHHYKSFFTDDEGEALAKYELACEMRGKFASKVHEIQTFESRPFITKSGIKILNFEIRNKMIRDGKEYFTSIIEKMIRKNLEFPNQVHDIIGLKIVVPEEEDIPKLIDELETFLGGSSTRKKEKNVQNKFGKRLLNKFSSGEYFVWKAIYDVALPHPSINKVLEILAKVKDKDSEVFDMLSKRIEFFKNNPRDFVVEVQIQDLSSYILSNTKGSIPHHSIMKMSQIKENSFFKLFPRDVYEAELLLLKHELLNPKN